MSTNTDAAPFDGNNLPAPRLQLRWAQSSMRSGYNWECHYELVLPLGEYDIRREQYDAEGNEIGKVAELVIPMKQPSLRGSSGTPCTSGDGSRFCDGPYRDGAHALWDAKILGDPPVFVIAPDGMAFAHKARN